MRSLLFVPAVEKMLNKISGFIADAYIVDLEDSIAPEKKVLALEAVKTYLNTYPQNIFVRLDGELMQEEIEELAKFDFEGYMIPKFEDPDAFEAYKGEFRSKKIIALVETPLGAINLEKIVSCDWVDFIAFGAEDFTSSIGMLNRADYLIGVRSRIVMYAKAYGKPVFDTPSFILDDPDALQKEVQLAQDMGFDGKLAINPKHVPIIEQVFKTCDTEYIMSIIKQYEDSGEAVLKIDGKVYEKMHINHLKKILKERV